MGKYDSHRKLLRVDEVDGGYPDLCLTMLKNTVRNIKNPHRGCCRAKKHEEVEWLKSERYWAKHRGEVWFAAWEYYFGWNESQMRSNLIRLIDKQIKKYSCG